VSGSGSYEVDPTGEGLDAELERLRLQAQAGWPQELQALRRAGLGTGDRILELGSGPGYVTTRLLDAFPVAHVTAVEIDAQMLGRAAAVTAPYGDRVAHVRASADDTGLPPDSFDFAVARYLFQHLEEPQAVAREALRLLRPGGTLAVIDVDGELWGVAQPATPEVGPIYAKAGRRQAARGGDRLIGRKLPRLLTQAGYEDVQLDAFVYHSDDVGLEPFIAQMHPSRLLPEYRDGLISASEWDTLHSAFKRFVEDRDALVLALGLVACGRKPSPEANR